MRTPPALPAVGPSEFIVLRRLEDSALPGETLLVFLRSHPVQPILKWSQNGSHLPRDRLPCEVTVARKTPSMFALKHHRREADFYAEVLSLPLNNKLKLGEKIVLNIAVRSASIRMGQLNLFFRYAPIFGASGFTSGPK